MDCSDCGEEIDEDNESQPVCPACGGSDFEDDFDLEEFEDITFHPVAVKSEAPTVKSVYKNVCWKCHNTVGTYSVSSRQCPLCRWYRCADCGSCKRGCPAPAHL